MKKFKKIIPIIITFIIGISTTVTAATIFNSKDITYSSDQTDKTNVKDSLDELYEKLGKCPEGYGCFELKGLAAKVELGDYISMTPTKTSYTISKDLTGHSSDQTINPSELNLWRVIRKNEDGTIDAVSEYVSSTPVSFYGRTGYINFVGALNTIAAQYTNDKYVGRTRHIGYSDQTEIITDTSKIDKSSVPWVKSTTNYDVENGCDTNTYLCGKDEELGAGDISYKTDYDLVNDVYGNMVGYTPTKSRSSYLIGSRKYLIEISSWGFRVRYFDPVGILSDKWLYGSNNNDMFQNNSFESALRPILTFKANVEIKSGDGKSIETAYRFE